jgi:adenylate cyclase
MSRPPWRSALLVSSVTSVAVVYLFVQAPPPLAEPVAAAGTVPIRSVFALLEHENDAARALWTSEIVNAGRPRGLTFGEHWREPEVASGPLPALFLRETARQLEREAPGLRLFLGSEYPINTANHFSGAQAGYFSRLVDTGVAQLFFEPASGHYTAMFADRAVVEACVTCHNEHPDSPKTDWKLDAIMGATTWMYPADTVTMQQAVEMIAALRRSIRAAYAGYLDKAATFPEPPPVGEGWPRDGRQLPSVDAFMAELARRSSTGTLRGLIEPALAEQIAEAASPPPVAKVAAPPPATPPATSHAPVPAAPDDVLVIRARRGKKVVVEHNGAQLVVARLRAGGVVSVSSPPPLRVRVDDPDAIVLEYRGKPIERADVEVVGAEDE